MLDRETAFCTEIFTTIIFMTVMHFDMLPSSENKEHLLKHCGLYATAYLHNTAYVRGWKYGRKKMGKQMQEFQWFMSMIVDCECKALTESCSINKPLFPQIITNMCPLLILILFIVYFPPRAHPNFYLQQGIAFTFLFSPHFQFILFSDQWSTKNSLCSWMKKGWINKVLRICTVSLQHKFTAHWFPYVSLAYHRWIWLFPSGLHSTLLHSTQYYHSRWADRTTKLVFNLYT